MKVTEIKPGQFRVQPSIDGKRYSLTFDHCPTEIEITKALKNKILNIPTTAYKPQIATSFEQCVKDYIELKKDRHSPRTRKEYSNLCNRFSEGFRKKKVTEITQLDIDKEVAEWHKKELSYKTMKNYFCMAQTVITKYGGEKFGMDMLPEKPQKEECYIPTKEDVKRLLEYMRDKYPNMYPAFWLTVYGLRRGEVCCLEMSDIDFENSIVSITKDMVQDENREWIIKEPKTQASKRKVGVSHDLTELIRLRGKIYDCNPHSLNKALARSQKALGITKFNLHKMRHYCCTELYEASVSENDILAYMGWSETSDVMREVYRHFRLRQDSEKQKKLGDILTNTYK